jgi:hypothetical protein
MNRSKRLQKHENPWIITEGKIHESSHLADKIYHFLHSRPVHYFMLALLVLDITLVVISIGLEIEYLHSKVKDYEDIVETCQNEITEKSNSSFRRSLLDAASPLVSYLNTSTIPVDQFAQRVLSSYSRCDDENVGNDDIHDAEENLAYLSMAILIVFIVENLILFLAKP